MLPDRSSPPLGMVPVAPGACTAREAAFRRECVEEAVASVRAEGLEPSAACLELLEAIAVGRIDEEQALDRLRRHYDCA